MKTNLALACAAFALLALPASAATMFIQLGTAAQGVDGFVFDRPNSTVDTLGGASTLSLAALASTESSGASASASLDAKTGVLRAALSTSAVPIPAEIPYDISALAGVSMGVFDTYTVTSSGMAKVRLAYDGAWSLTGNSFDNTQQVLFFVPSWRFQGGVSVSRSLDGAFIENAFDSFLYSPDNSSASDRREGILTAIMPVTAGERLVVSSSLFLEIGTGLGRTIGIADFSRTAYLSVSFFDGASGIPDDPRFLSVDPRPDNPAVIPLPASALLLPFGLGLMAALRRRRAV
jgi:hypothetical protein